ncbi:hypothetical protein Pryu01_02878 [Paraliobacillus ryukyuensis]|uniref:Uncharacterized protein n=1 Tax=Paraliobacillus ryukyuensis TaxID=200904 RepID=A0A366E1K9_9BACI|nr:hypothetical protein [Paraliobacillus ryukyuensis]RBO95384.1 hypothetical protein DES48_10895 [Paraliobacillus ryukyuensis]
MSNKEEGENVKEFMELLMELKISITQLTAKVDQLTDMKNVLEETKKIGNETAYRSFENEKDIDHLLKKVAEKASKEDVNRIVEEKDNWRRTFPSWVAVAIAAIALILPFLTN